MNSRASTQTADVVLAERVSPDGRCRWQARRSSDRGRLVVVGIVEPSDVPTVIEPLSEHQLRALLDGDPPAPAPFWVCARCSSRNAVDRRWCGTCSEAV